METSTDVRINFSRSRFDKTDHQVLYDGPHNFEKTDKQVALLIPSLPPGDSVTLSFVFSPLKSNIDKIQDLFLSAKSRECVAKPLERTKSIGEESPHNMRDWAGPGLAIILGLIVLSLTVYYSHKSGSLWALSELIDEFVEQMLEKTKVEKITNEIARLTVQVSNPVAPGTEADVECYIENMSTNPFAGYIALNVPSWAERLNTEKVNIGSKSRELVKWKFKVPKDVHQGKYSLSIELTGKVFDQSVRLETTEMIEVRL